MGVYSKVDLSEIREILAHYHLGEVKEFFPTVKGISNSNFKVVLESGQEVLLKISNDKTIEQLQNEQDILKILQKYNFKYSLRPFDTIQGTPIYQHNGFYGVVFPFVNGLPPMVTGKVCREIGRALGELHCLKYQAEDLSNIRSHNLVGYGGVSIYEFTRTPAAPFDFVEAFEKIFPNKLQDIPYGEFPEGIIHGDLYYDNTLFNEGELVTLIDFEQSGRGTHILDLGIAISGCCFNTARDNLDPELIDSFLNGYQSVHQLTKLEQEYLNTAILVGFFSIGLWRIKRFYEGNLDASKRTNYRQLLERAENFAKLVGPFK